MKDFPFTGPIIPHTPAPWVFHEQGDANDYCLLTSDKKGWIVAFTQNGELSTDRQLANARRMCAAVNACEGISTEELEKGIVRELISALEYLLEEVCKRGGEPFEGASDTARLALARAKGEK